MDEFIVEKASELKKQYGTSDPFVLLEELGVTVKYSSGFHHLKAFYYIMLDVPYVVMSDRLEESELPVIAAHELGHHILHRQFAEDAPLREFGLYDMRSQPEREANLFAAELLIDDEVLQSLIREENDYFKISALLGVPPELLSFKLNSLNKREGSAYRIPVCAKSDFLAK